MLHKMLTGKVTVLFLVCISVQLVSAQNRRWSRLCERMTMCDLNRFTRTHTKQIATVKNNIQNIDVLLNGLQNRSTTILEKLDGLEERYEKIIHGDNTQISPRIEKEEDTVYGDVVDRLRTADGELNDDVAVLKDMLEGAKDDVQNILTVAKNQQEEVNKVKENVSKNRDFLNPIMEFVNNYEDGLGIGDDDKTEDAVIAEVNQLSLKQAALEEQLQRLLVQYALKERKSPKSAKDLKAENIEIGQIKASMSSLVLQVDNAKRVCMSKNIALAAELNVLHNRIKTLGSRNSPCLCW